MYQVTNPQLGRKVLDQIDAHPESLKMSTWGVQTPCGTVACLAGHTMLAAGYQLVAVCFIRPDGSVVGREAREAERLLGIIPSDEDDEGDEMWHDIWYDYQHGPDRFREMIEKAEANL